jgi:hypothetical protein
MRLRNVERGEVHDGDIGLLKDGDAFGSGVVQGLLNIRGVAVERARSLLLDCHSNN